MSDNRRYYTVGVEAALHVMSGGGCYRPGCGEPTIRFVDGEPQKNLEIAHIHALRKKDARWDPAIPESELNSYPNLILLCGTCHKRVDNNEGRYPATLLKEWKADREEKPLGSLAGLKDLDKADMEKLLDNAMSSLREEMATFTNQFPELATILRNTIEAFPQLDPDSVNALYTAASRLGLPDYAPLLHNAAVRLELQDYAPILDSAARRLTGLADHAPQLLEAANILASLPDVSSTLKNAAMTTEDCIARATMRLSDAATEVEEAANTTSVTEGPAVIKATPAWYWKAMVAGWAGWLAFAFTMLIIWLATRGK